MQEPSLHDFQCDEKTPCSNCVRRKEECDNFLPQSVRAGKNCFNQQNTAVSKSQKMISGIVSELNDVGVPSSPVLDASLYQAHLG